MDKKEVLRKVVRDYLADQAPQLAEEYEIVFDDVYETIEYRLGQETQAPEPDEEAGLNFDAGVVAGTLISIPCWIGMKLLIAATKVEARHAIPDALDRMEKRLVSWNCKPEMVRALHKRIQEYMLEAFS